MRQRLAARCPGVQLHAWPAARARSRGSDAEFVALEKVHGSNFAFETDGRTRAPDFRRLHATGKPRAALSQPIARACSDGWCGGAVLLSDCKQLHATSKREVCDQ